MHKPTAEAGAKLLGGRSVEPQDTPIVTTPTRPPVVTRFAPSPTGFLHIGGARTALFNWLFARHHGGQFLLRIEDTDRARSTEPAIAAILDGMRWLGLEWDGDESYQFARADRHAAVAHQLVAAGRAYRCHLTPDELTAQREAAKVAKRPFRLDSPWRDADPATAPDTPAVVRLKVDKAGSTTIADRVQGDVTVANEEVDDFVLLRSDGTPTYMLAVVVDDHDAGVTHVIRGDDHLNNAFRQLALLRALDWPEPIYAHVPMIHGPDGAKLSKRHGALGVDAYRDELGLLPEAVMNYLLRLGWSHGDDEIIAIDDAVRWFGLDGVGSSPSRFDLAKLESLNAHYLRAADPERLAGLVAERLGRSANDWPLLTQAMPHLTVRAKTLVEVADGARFLFERADPADDAKAAAALDADGLALVADLHGRLANVEDWTAEALEVPVRALAEERDLKLGKVAQPLRAALTGRSTSPGIFDVLALLGQDESLRRLDDTVAV